jgi:hypothetical protein
MGSPLMTSIVWVTPQFLPLRPAQRLEAWVHLSWMSRRSVEGMEGDGRRRKAALETSRDIARLETDLAVRIGSRYRRAGNLNLPCPMHERSESSQRAGSATLAQEDVGVRGAERRRQRFVCASGYASVGQTHPNAGLEGPVAAK